MVEWFRRSDVKIKTIDKKEIAEGLWVKCPRCNQVIYQRELEKNQHVCRSCSHHFRMSSNNYFSLLLDDNDNEKIIELHCTYDPTTKGGWSDDGRKVRGTLHWVSAYHAIDAEVRLYDHLFHIENQESRGDDFIKNLNPNSIIILNNCKLEPSLKNAELGIGYQFLRLGYFCLDMESTPDSPIFNRATGLRDNWAKKNNC